VPVLSAYGVTRVVSSDSKRCVRTVAPYADDHVLAVETLSGINEEEATPDSVNETVAMVLAQKESAVLCSHRPVLPEILAALGVAEEPLAPGEMVVCHHRKGRVVAVERHLVL
jgi:phosphohistidine phosphatase SixA